MFNFYGIELQDDYDLFMYRDPNETNKVIFLTSKGEPFHSAFLVKIFKTIEKIGEVRIHYLRINKGVFRQGIPFRTKIFKGSIRDKKHRFKIQ